MSIPELADDLLRGGKQLARIIYGKDDRQTLRKLYYEVEQGRWPVFQHDENGLLYGLKSRIEAHIAAKSAEQEARLATAQQATAFAEKKAKPPSRRGRRRLSK